MKNIAASVSERLTSQDAACLPALWCNNLLHSAHFAGFEAHLDAMRVMSGTGQYLLHDSTRPLSSTLILFLDDVDLKPRLYVFSVLAIHISSLPRKIATQAPNSFAT